MKLKISKLKEDLIRYSLRISDNALILGQRLAEWCGHGPVLEQDIALSNIALDLIGQSRNYFQFISSIDDENRSEDEWAFLREERDYLNILLVEQPNDDFAHTIVRQFFFDSFHLLFNQALKKSSNQALSSIAQKSVKEIEYHLHYSSEWMLRLGDGTEESHSRMQDAIDDLWMYAEEVCTPDALDDKMASSGVGLIWLQ